MRLSHRRNRSWSRACHRFVARLPSPPSYCLPGRCPDRGAAPDRLTSRPLSPAPKVEPLAARRGGTDRGRPTAAGEIARRGRPLPQPEHYPESRCRSPSDAHLGRGFRRGAAGEGRAADRADAAAQGDRSGGEVRAPNRGWRHRRGRDRRQGECQRAGRTGPRRPAAGPRWRPARPLAAGLAPARLDARPDDRRRVAAGPGQPARRRRPGRHRPRRPGGQAEPAQVSHRRPRRGRLRPHHHRPDLLQPRARRGWRGRSTSRCRPTPRCRGWRCTWTATSWKAAWSSATTAATSTRRIVHQQQDPALLEWVDGSTFKMRVFPLEPRRRSASSSATRRGCRRCTARRATASRPATAWRWSATGRSTPASRAAPGWTGAATRTQLKASQGRRRPAARRPRRRTCKARPRRRADLADREAPAGGRRPLLVGRARGGEVPDGALSARRCRGRRRQARQPRATGSSCSSRPATATRCWPARRSRSIRGAAGQRRAPTTPSPCWPPARAVAVAGERAAAGRRRRTCRRRSPSSRRRHLIGALDLGQALTAAEPLLQAGREPATWSTSAAASPAMGERRDGRAGPAHSRRARATSASASAGAGTAALMKAAAERTGGYFTQINPDEPIAWRGFELAATLRHAAAAGRRRSTDDAGEDAPFLHFNQLAGPGRGAVRRRPPRRQAELPETVTVAGTLDGKPFAPRAAGEGRAGEGAATCRGPGPGWRSTACWPRTRPSTRSAIIELSKAMYVMTPFTSLLVLENEEMYKQYKVDRGRKDHWAMYPCPQKIPVVVEEDPSIPSRPTGTPTRSLTVREVLQTVATRQHPIILSIVQTPQSSEVKFIHENDFTHYRTAQAPDQISKFFYGMKATEHQAGDCYGENDVPDKVSKVGRARGLGLR